MKYKRTDRVQSADFSCLEELKCDVIDNLLSMIKNNSDDTLGIIYIIADNKKALKLFEKLFKADINGFNFELFNDEEEVKLYDLKNEKELLITVFTDGCIWIQGININDYLDSDFYYIDADINSKWFRKIDDDSDEILIFNIED